MRVSNNGIEINAFEDNIDTKMSGDVTDGLFFLDASEDAIGIGGQPSTDVERLHVKGTGTGNLVRLESTDDGATAAPVLQLYRNSASPATNDRLGEIKFSGEDSGGSEETYCYVDAFLDDATAGSEGASMYFYARGGGTIRNICGIRGNTQTFQVNPNNGDVNFEANGDTVSALLHVDASQDNVGIGGTPSSGVERLHVKGTGTGTLVRLESTDAGAGQAPILDFYRNSASPLDGDDIGKIVFSAEDDAGAKQTYASIFGELSDVNVGTNLDARLIIQAMSAGNETWEYMRVGAQDIVFNETSQDINFRIESNGNVNMLKVDGNLDLIGISAAPTSGGATLQVPDNTISSYCNVKAVRSDGVATQTFLNEDCQGQTWVNDSSTAWTLDLPESTVKGMHFYFVSTNGDITVDPNPSGGTSVTLNGGTGALSRNTNYEVYHVICYDTNKWLLTNPA